MSAVLLDTPTFIWWATDDRALSPRSLEVLKSPETDILLSAVVAWEIAIKAGLGRLELGRSLTTIVTQQVARHGMIELPVTLDHAMAVQSLPRHHGDPFDRLLIAQARIERVPIVTADPWIERYGVKTIW